MAGRARKQPPSTPKQKAARKKLRELRDKGVYGGKIGTGPITSYQYSVLSKFRDVTTGKATVVKADKKATREFRSAGATTYKDRVIVQADPKEQIRFNKKTRQLLGKRIRDERTGAVYRNISFHKVFKPEELLRPPAGEVYRYRVAFKHPGRKTGYTPWFEDYGLFLNFMQGYDARKVKESGAKSRKDKIAVRDAYQEIWTGQVDVQAKSPPKKRLREIEEEEWEIDEEGDAYGFDE